MAQGNTNRAALFWAAESTWGAPATTPTLKTMRFTGESLGHRKNAVQSAELRSDGEVPDLIEVGASAGGNINIELSPATYDDFLANLLRGAWVDKTGYSGSVTFTSGSKTLAGTGIGTNLVVGQYIRVSGASQAANNTFFTVATQSANSITVLETVTTEGPTASVKVDGSRLRNGTTESFFTIERVFQDLTSQHFHQFPGCEVDTLQLTAQADQIVNGVLGIIGKEESTPASVTFGNGSPTAATTTDVFNATSHVGTLMEGYPTMTALTNAIQGVQFTINSNRQGRRAIKNRGAIGVRQGRFVTTGTITAYFENGALLAKMIAHNNSAFHMRLHDTPATPPLGYSLFITFPRLKFSGGDPSAAAVDQDVLHPLAFQAIRDPTLGCSVQFDRFPWPQP